MQRSWSAHGHNVIPGADRMGNVRDEAAAGGPEFGSLRLSTLDEDYPGNRKHRNLIVSVARTVRDHRDQCRAGASLKTSSRDRCTAAMIVSSAYSP